MIEHIRPSDLPADRPVFVVLIEQVPDLVYLRVDKQSGELDLTDPPRRLHTNDRQPIEVALRAAESCNGLVIAVAVDRRDADEGLREALAIGADIAILLASRAVAHADAVARANFVAQLIQRLPRCDGLFVGTETMEPDWSIMGGALAAILGWPLVPGGHDITVDPKIEQGPLRPDGVTAQGVAMFGADLIGYKSVGPTVVTVRPDSVKPRWASSYGVSDAYETKLVHAWDLNDLEVDGRQLARMASVVENRSQRIIRAGRGQGETFTDPPEQAARVLGKRLARMGFLGGF